MPLAIVVAAVAAISGFLIGYDTAVIAGALEFIARDFVLDAFTKGVVVTAILVGGLAGAGASGSIAGRFGQRPTLMATAFLFAACALGSAFAEDVYALTSWRFGLGLAVGAATMVAPLYVAETAPSAWRGALVSGIQMAITVGILSSYLVGLAFTASGEWRMMLGLGAVPAVLLLGGLMFLPESPRWLVLAGREEAGRKSWRSLLGGEWPEEDLAVIRHAGDEPKARLRDLFAPRLRPVLMVAAGLFLFTNLSGIDAILYYAPEIFRQVGFGGPTGPILATAGLGAINVVSTIAAMWLIDRVGRRPLLLWGLAPMTLALATMALALSLDPGGAISGTVTLICLAAYIVAFAVSLGPLPYVLMSELFPAAIRALGMSLAAATAWGVNAVVSLSFLPLMEWIGIAPVFALFAVVCAVAFAYTKRVVPETKGRSLEHIEQNLLAGRPTRELGD
ncbi:MAG: sugar porter family MFS transporter [Rhodospirillaceae bacterium]|nr:sugar porter family MFS transporter [Rhodospirillaceae bacterium]